MCDFQNSKWKQDYSHQMKTVEQLQREIGNVAIFRDKL
jgi:hypothetical protein